MDEVSIQLMMEADLPEVLAIEALSFPIPFTEKLFRMELNLRVARLYVAKEKGKIIGYIDYWNIETEIHVITFAVHPDWRRRQIGSRLLQFMMDDGARSHVKLYTLDVRASNQTAIRLYEKFGFRQTGLRKKYYQDNEEDALIMSCTVA